MTCTAYDDRTRCSNPAVAYLLAPDGKRIPGGPVCWEHGAAPLCEYQEKLGEEWRAETVSGFEVTTWDNLVMDTPLHTK